MSEALIAILSAIGFVVLFPVFWMAIVFLISRIGGWAGLAERFTTDQKPSGDQFSLASLRLGYFGNYSNCVNVAISAQGIRLHPIFLFRAGHKPLLIPWNAILELKQTRLWLFSITKLTIKGGDSFWRPSIALYGSRILESVKHHAPGRLLQN